MLALMLSAALVWAGAICNDGWVSSSTGSGTCSWHGGVREWTASSAPQRYSAQDARLALYQTLIDHEFELQEMFIAAGDWQAYADSRARVEEYVCSATQYCPKLSVPLDEPDVDMDVFLRELDRMFPTNDDPRSMQISLPPPPIPRDEQALVAQEVERQRAAWATADRKNPVDPQKVRVRNVVCVTVVLGTSLITYSVLQAVE